MEEIVVLVVEDDALIQMEIEEILQQGGYSTIAEVSGESAIALLETGNVRALVTDVNLTNEISGWDVARRARQLFPDLPVIYVTSVAADEWSAEGVPNSLLIAKPFAAAQLVTAVSELLNKQSPSA